MVLFLLYLYILCIHINIPKLCSKSNTRKRFNLVIKLCSVYVVCYINLSSIPSDYFSVQFIYLFFNISPTGNSYLFLKKFLLSDFLSGFPLIIICLCAASTFFRCLNWSWRCSSVFLPVQLKTQAVLLHALPDDAN